MEKVRWKHLNSKFPPFTLWLQSAKYEQSPKINAILGLTKQAKWKDSNQETVVFENPIKRGNFYERVIWKDLFRASYNQFKKNKGAMTPGVKESTADFFSEQTIERIHKQLKSKTFKWGPVKRIEIQKPGGPKDVTRPLAITDFKDKPVQNNIMWILTAIYEPEFEALNSNFRFRP